MSVASGTKLGPYEIVGRLGAGGMGEVYSALDTRLDRTVAIKILPAQFSSDLARKQRFEREAKTIAILNDPHICVLYDVGQQDGTDYLVMEYVEGETLAKRLEKGPLPLDQVLKIGIEMAGALDKGHRQGIIHRDLKPSNIMLTKSGAKLMDFGLAKASKVAFATDASGGMTTVSDPLTEEGIIVGTFQYMAPEQLEGKEIDARTDIFALGAVVYEMATGRKAFEGGSRVSVIGKILQVGPPPASSLRPMTPPALDRAIKRCLEKDADERWQTARDLMAELKWVAEGCSRVSASADVQQTSSTGKRSAIASRLGRPTMMVGLVALLLGAAIATLMTWKFKPSPPAAVTRFTITLPADQRLVTSQHPLALSPDGSKLAYAAIQSGLKQIHLRALDAGDTKAMAGTEGGDNPFFSPDGSWLGFVVEGELKKVSINGGTPLRIASIGSTPNGASWGSQGLIVFGRVGGPLQQVPDSGGTPEPVTRLGKDEVAHIAPDFLPSAREVLFASVPGFNLSVRPLGRNERRLLVQGPALSPRYASSGHLLYARDGNLMAAPFDVKRMEITGAAVRVVDGVRQRYGRPAGAAYSISAGGTLAYVSGGLESQRKLVWVSRQGTEQPLAVQARSYGQPTLSHDGKRIAVVSDAAIWIYDIALETLTRLTVEEKLLGYPLWSPDSQRIAFSSNRDGPLNVYWQHADRGGLERLITSPYIQMATSWSPDGQMLAITENNPTTGYDILVLRLSDRKVEAFVQTPFNEGGAQFSPDGHWIAYVSDETGRNEVYVQPYPGPGRKLQISTQGGTEPLWSRNGRALYYRSGDKMMAAQVSAQPGFVVSKPQLLFAGQYEPAQLTRANYDVSADGQRFLMVKSSEEQAGTQVNIVLNWFEELKRRVPTGRK